MPVVSCEVTHKGVVVEEASWGYMYGFEFLQKHGNSIKKVLKVFSAEIAETTDKRPLKIVFKPGLLKTDRTYTFNLK